LSYLIPTDILGGPVGLLGLAEWRQRRQVIEWFLLAQRLSVRAAIGGYSRVCKPILAKSLISTLVTRTEKMILGIAFVVVALVQPWIRIDILPECI
jgi:hypothetical protein